MGAEAIEIEGWAPGGGRFEYRNGTNIELAPPGIEANERTILSRKSFVVSVFHSTLPVVVPGKAPLF
jgi:hypothetical protein